MNLLVLNRATIPKFPVPSKGHNNTYVDIRGNTVINYVLCSERAYEEVEEFKVGDRVDSDLMPIMVTLEEKDKRGGRKEEEGENKKKEKEKSVRTKNLY